MALYNELPEYKATYDLLLAIFQFTKEFSKEYKYTVGEKVCAKTCPEPAEGRLRCTYTPG